MLLTETAFPSGMPGSSVSSYILLYKLRAKYMEIPVAFLWATDKRIKTKQHPICFGICIILFLAYFSYFCFLLTSS